MAQRGGSMEDLDEYIIASLSGGGWGDLVDGDTSNKYNDDNITVICCEDGSCGGMHLAHRRAGCISTSIVFSVRIFVRYPLSFHRLHSFRVGFGRMEEG
jgi:hypothetical protein